MFVEDEIDAYFNEKRKEKTVFKMMREIDVERRPSPVSIVDKYIIKGIIHFIDSDLGYEVIEEDFFFTGLEPNGCFLSQSDIDVDLTYNLAQEDFCDFKPKEDECYSVLWIFTLNHFHYDTSCGVEYDSEIETKVLIFDLIDEEHSKWLLEN